ncbi:TetR/AcrR family transcriptional regulator [Humibacter sp. RRB41]|uniref:TetR/AcrR family transcriptional regulator n=1 Tax=Humibacter sp. RRB41 TaxID=2919946 RepID=UPI001FA95826|nr:TetR/AcrR family transcriptional regulator C-terminal domain-containing protein [Humibacter sp. RRB41]
MAAGDAISARGSGTVSGTTASVGREDAGHEDAPHADAQRVEPTGLVAILWSEERPVKRGPKPKLTLAQVVDGGIAIADEDGLEAVTMQRLADRLGATKMALYRYVPSRAELDALMLDRALGAPGEIAGVQWRETLTKWAMEFFERAVAHAWSVELAQRTHTPGPRELQWFEVGLAAMTGLPLASAEKLDVLALLSGHVLSLVRRSTVSSSPEDDLAGSIVPILAIHADAYPFTAAAFADASDGGRDAGLRFGIDRALDGVEAMMQRRASAAPSAALPK